jgi:hypothetical protein
LYDANTNVHVMPLNYQNEHEIHKQKTSTNQKKLFKPKFHFGKYSPLPKITMSKQVSGHKKSFKQKFCKHWMKMMVAM